MSNLSPAQIGRRLDRARTSGSPYQRAILEKKHDPFAFALEAAILQRIESGQPTSLDAIRKSLDGAFTVAQVKAACTRLAAAELVDVLAFRGQVYVRLVRDGAK